MVTYIFEVFDCWYIVKKDKVKLVGQPTDHEDTNNNSKHNHNLNIIMYPVIKKLWFTEFYLNQKTFVYRGAFCAETYGLQRFMASTNLWFTEVHFKQKTLVYRGSISSRNFWFTEVHFK